jgi:putative Ig domain-containing protein
MNRFRVLFLPVAMIAAAFALLLGGARAEDTATNGTFRFLTQTLPVGTTNGEYVARLLTANSDGPVTFTLGATALPAGLTLDYISGFITGRPTETFSKDVTFFASAGVDTISVAINLKVNASGGGGNAGATFGGFPLPDGRIGEAYSHTISLTNGVGPYVYGAASLPPGLSLDGLTGAITGTPAAAGTFNLELTATDHGENESKAVTVQPLKILPSGTSDFSFTKTQLGNGEVGTPFCDTWTVQRTIPGPVVTPTFTATGLPAGLSVAPGTGVVSGMPTAAGTFEVVMGCTAGGETITTNLRMTIAPSSTSNFYWDFFGLPSAIVNVLFTRQPPILVTAANGTTVTYAAVGLPAGIVYDAITGELSGTATEVGEYPVLFTATDTTTSQTISLSLDFVVLPPNGGSATQIAVNAWLTKMKVKSGNATADKWKGACIYNADRRTGRAFDPTTQSLVLQIGSSQFRVEPGTLKPAPGGRAYHTDRGVLPAIAVYLAAPRQTLTWSVRGATLTETLPNVLTEQILVGSRGYRLETFVEERGKLAVPAGLRRAAFVVPKAAIAVGGDGKDALAISFLLSDLAFTYEPAVSTLRLRLLDGANVLADRDFTALGKATLDATKTGSAAYKLTAAEDEETASHVAKFVFAGAKGAGVIGLSGLTLSALPDQEAHLGVELTIGSRVYFTSVTFFEKKANRYSVP